MKTVSWKANLPCFNCENGFLDYRLSFNVEKKDFEKVKILKRCIKCGFPRTTQSNILSFDKFFEKVFSPYSNIKRPEMFQSPDIEIPITYFRDCN